MQNESALGMLAFCRRSLVLEWERIGQYWINKREMDSISNQCHVILCPYLNYTFLYTVSFPHLEWIFETFQLFLYRKIFMKRTNYIRLDQIIFRGSKQLAIDAIVVTMVICVMYLFTYLCTWSNWWKTYDFCWIWINRIWNQLKSTGTLKKKKSK